MVPIQQITVLGTPVSGRALATEFPRRDRIWLKRLFLSRTDLCIHSQVSQYACDNDALAVYVEVIEVLLRTFR